MTRLNVDDFWYIRHINAYLRHQPACNGVQLPHNIKLAFSFPGGKNHIDGFGFTLSLFQFAYIMSEDFEWINFHYGGFAAQICLKAHVVVPVVIRWHTSFLSRHC